MKMYLIIGTLLMLWQVQMTSQSQLQTKRKYHNDTYRAAVYEHRRVDRDENTNLHEWVAQNMQVFQEKAREARLQNVEIIVFPEYGLGTAPTRDTIFPMLELLPDPEATVYNPCNDEENAISKPVQYGFSCMAKENSIYVIGNMGEVVYCDGATDPYCQEDGKYQYNTNVVFDPEGNLIAKYNKEKLYYEDAFDEPMKTQFITFDTPFGKFGTFICFDVLFLDPAVTLVEQYGVTNIAYPTAWRSSLPLMHSLGYHEAFAIKHGVNFLSAELHNPGNRFSGSGLYAGSQGALSFFLDIDPDSDGDMIIHDMPITPLKNLVAPVDSLLPPDPAQETFTSTLQGDLYTFVLLDPHAKHARLSDGRIICNLDYEIENFQATDFYALGVFDDLHTSAHNSYIQVCTILKCANNTSHDSCGKMAITSSTFVSFKLRGEFETSYIYPEVIFDGLVVNKKSWSAHFDEGQSGLYRGEIDGSKLTENLVAAALYGRVYERDAEGHRKH